MKTQVVLNSEKEGISNMLLPMLSKRIDNSGKLPEIGHKIITDEILDDQKKSKGDLAFQVADVVWEKNTIIIFAEDIIVLPELESENDLTMQDINNIHKSITPAGEHAPN